ncbi:unnamed protein product [Cuscuta epithymum]|uniref:Aminotransferase-like plant mobile domain-containing protein n=1 Tax=Cuscuta epithymum TaxID=186058 RepID=A0AAV0D9P6_9ASTE|nr:unnamed protein product [Cuscuta epithymum]
MYGGGDDPIFEDTPLGREDPPPRPDIPFATIADRRRFQVWGQYRTLLAPMILDQAMLEAWGYWSDIDALLGDSLWRRILLIQERASLPLTMEFLCSLQFTHYGQTVQEGSVIGSETQMRFTIRGIEHSISVAELGWRRGLYAPAYTQTEEFRTLSTRLPEAFDIEEFWRRHSTDTRSFLRQHPHSNKWRETHWYILSFVLSCGLFGRPHNTNRVSKKDILFFWSLVHRTPVNMAVLMARFFRSQGKTVRRTIQAGPFVTTLVRSFYPTLDIPGLLHLQDSIRVLRSSSFGNMKIKKKRSIQELPGTEQSGSSRPPPHRRYSEPSSDMPSASDWRAMIDGMRSLQTSVSEMRVAQDRGFQEMREAHTAVLGEFRDF